MSETLPLCKLADRTEERRMLDESKNYEDQVFTKNATINGSNDFKYCTAAVS